jgi:hypothetical protein
LGHIGNRGEARTVRFAGQDSFPGKKIEIAYANEKINGEVDAGGSFAITSNGDRPMEKIAGRCVDRYRGRSG